MAYTRNVKISARRHLKSALVLHTDTSAGSQPGCQAVAGYLFGLAAELAVKEIMRDSGIMPLKDSERRDDPYYAHFPELKTMLSTAYGRRSGELRKLSEDSSLFQNWDVVMRYAPTVEISANHVAAWKLSAEKLIDRMEAE
jgi:hypothetical protein